MSSKSAQSKTTLPNIKHSDEENGVLNFTIENCNVSIANALRRTILSDIPTVIIKNIDIYANTTKFNNEILKHRLECMPVHIKDFDSINDLKLKIDETNDTNSLLYITTRNIRIVNKNTDTPLTTEEEKSIFPFNEMTRNYPLFARLRPQLTKELPGETIKLSAELGLGKAIDKGMYNVACTCAYRSSPDVTIQNDEWQKVADKLQDKGFEPSAIAYEKENWFALQAKRFYKDDSFDFKVETVGVYSNIELINIACDIIIKSLMDIDQKATSNTIELLDNTNTIENCFDIVLQNYGYTIGKVIEYILHNEYFQKDKQLSYLGFLKRHPHDDFSIIRIAFINNEMFNKTNCYNLISFACKTGIEIFDHIKEAF